MLYGQIESTILIHVSRKAHQCSTLLCFSKRQRLRPKVIRPYFWALICGSWSPLPRRSKRTKTAKPEAKIASLLGMSCCFTTTGRAHVRRAGCHQIYRSQFHEYQIVLIDPNNDRKSSESQGNSCTRHANPCSDKTFVEPLPGSSVLLS
ncbi:hypothetical protein BDV18DRAFT_136831 [Aspergillus unguis]